MKPILFLLAFLFASSLTAKKAHPGPCGTTRPLYTTLRQTPVIVYAYLTGYDSITLKYSMTVIEVLKGNNIPKNITNINVKYDDKNPSSRFLSKGPQAKSLFYLYKNSQNNWEINNDWCHSTPPPCENKTILLDKPVSFANFRTGLALFMQNYDQLIQQKAKGKKVVVPKNMKNATYRYLVNDMNSPDQSRY
jgi:hypothetical protein